MAWGYTVIPAFAGMTIQKTEVFMKRALFVRLLGVSAVAAVAALLAFLAPWPASPGHASNVTTCLGCPQTQLTEGDSFEASVVFSRSDRYNDRFIHADFLTDDAPTGISSLEVISSPADGHAYRTGENIEILARFNRDVAVEKPVLLPLRVGSGPDYWRGAALDRRHEDSDRAWVFVYEVHPRDLDLNGLSIDGGFTDEGGTVHSLAGSGSITDAETGEPISRFFGGLGHDRAHRVAGVPSVTDISITSTPARGTIYAARETIEITMTFDQAVTVEGDKIVGMRMGTGAGWWRGVWYDRGSGTDTLVFSYEVQAGDYDNDGISLDGGFTDENGTTHGFGGGGSIVSAVGGYPVNPHYPHLTHQEGHRVGVLHVTDVSITSNPGPDRTYKAGNWIEVTVTFSADVMKTGIPQVTMEFDSGTVTAPYIAFWSNQILFGYGVKVGDMDKDGIVIGANAISLNGGSIHDLSGRDAELFHAALPTLAGHMVEAPGGL